MTFLVRFVCGSIMFKNFRNTKSAFSTFLFLNWFQLCFHFLEGMTGGIFEIWGHAHPFPPFVPFYRGRVKNPASFVRITADVVRRQNVCLMSDFTPLHSSIKFCDTNSANVDTPNHIHWVQTPARKHVALLRCPWPTPDSEWDLGNQTWPRWD